MPQKSSPLLNIKCICAITVALLFFSCRKSKPEATGTKQLNLIINVHNLRDTTLVFNDTETYRIANSITGEGRCPNLNCTGCPGIPGKCDEMLRIYNKSGDSISLHMWAVGCRIDLTNDLFMNNLQEVNPRFHFQIGLLKISPYPDLSNYQNPDSSIDFNKYVSTYVIVK